MLFSRHYAKLFNGVILPRYYDTSAKQVIVSPSHGGEIQGSVRLNTFPNKETEELGFEPESLTSNFICPNHYALHFPFDIDCSCSFLLDGFFESS